MWQSIKNTKEKVKHILTSYESTRDSDMKLLSIFWMTEQKEIFTESFLKNLHRLTPAESIMRCRRKLQEQYPNLRGNRYQERQAECDLITKQIRLL